MAAGMASRPVEEGAVAEFLDSASRGRSGFLFDGGRGVGKSTLWLTGQQRARELGFQVLSARVAAAESVLAYTSLADLLSGVDPANWADLPDPQRVAVDRLLLRGPAAGATTDRRAVAAAFLSIVERLTDDGPVLLAIDDLQWLHPSTAD